MSSDKAINPYDAIPNSKKMMTVVGVYIALLGSIMQSATSSTLLPVAAAEIGGTEIYSLASTIAGIPSIALMPLYAYFAVVKPSIKRPLAAYSLLVGAGVILARSFATSMMMIIIPGSLWGLVSAGIYVLGYSIIRDLYDAKKAGTYLGTCATMMAIGMLAGPVIGGFIMDMGGWRMVCHVIWPLVSIGALLILFGAKAPAEVDDAAPKGAKKIDIPGTIAVCVFTACIILGLSLTSTYAPFGSIQSNLLFAGAAISLAALIYIIVTKQSDAILPAPAFKDRNVISFAVANLFISFSQMAVFFFLPSYALYVIGTTATQASLTTTMLSVAGLFLGPIVGGIIGKTGTAKNVLAAVTAIRVIDGIVLMLILTPTTPLLVIYAIVLVMSIHNGAQGAIFSAGPMVQLKEDIRIQGNSVIQMSQNLGSSIGTATYTVVIGLFGITEGFPIALIISSVTAGVALAAALCLKKLD